MEALSPGLSLCPGNKGEKCPVEPAHRERPRAGQQGTWAQMLSVTSCQQTWRTEDWKQEGCGFPAGRGTAALASAFPRGPAASLSLSGPPRSFYVGGAGGAPKITPFHHEHPWPLPASAL